MEKDNPPMWICGPNLDEEAETERHSSRVLLHQTLQTTLPEAYTHSHSATDCKAVGSLNRFSHRGVNAYTHDKNYAHHSKGVWTHLPKSGCKTPPSPSLPT